MQRKLTERLFGEKHHENHIAIERLHFNEHPAPAEAVVVFNPHEASDIGLHNKARPKRATIGSSATRRPQPWVSAHHASVTTAANNTRRLVIERV